MANNPDTLEGEKPRPLAEGKKAARKEQSMTLWQAVRLYPKAVGWSVLLSSTLIMEGYDLALLGSMYASPAFNQKYGVQSASGKWTVPASWQSALSNGARVGEVIGLLINGLISERLGYRWTMVSALAAMNAVIFLFFFAVDIKIAARGGDPGRDSLGHLPDSARRICLGSVPRRSPPVLDDVYQHVLGHRAVRRCGCESRIHPTPRPVGVPDPLRSPVGMATPDPHWHPLRARIPLVACPTR